MLRPILDWVVIARDESEETSPGGIVIPDSAQQKVTRGTVLAVGPGVKESDKLATRLQKAVAEHYDADSHLVKECLAVVEALRRRTPQLKEGDHVLFGKYTGNEVMVRDAEGNDRDCIVSRDVEIYGVIEQ
jgi:chaperonin GroES